MRKYGYSELADSFTRNIFDRLKGISGGSPIHENYDARTGAALEAPHFSWSAAALMMLYRDYGKNFYIRGSCCKFVNQPLQQLQQLCLKN